LAGRGQCGIVASVSSLPTGYWTEQLNNTEKYSQSDCTQAQFLKERANWLCVEKGNRDEKGWDLVTILENLQFQLGTDKSQNERLLVWVVVNADLKKADWKGKAPPQSKKKKTKTMIYQGQNLGHGKFYVYFIFFLNSTRAEGRFFFFLWEKSPFTAHKPSELNRIPECGLSG
jgi:hypothetical protein